MHDLSLKTVFSCWMTDTIDLSIKQVQRDWDAPFSSAVFITGMTKLCMYLRLLTAHVCRDLC